MPPSESKAVLLCQNIRNNPRTELNFFEQLNTGIEPRFRRGHPEPRLLHMKQSLPCGAGLRPAAGNPLDFYGALPELSQGESLRCVFRRRSDPRGDRTNVLTVFIPHGMACIVNSNSNGKGKKMSTGDDSWFKKTKRAEEKSEEKRPRGQSGYASCAPSLPTILTSHAPRFRR